MNQYFTVDYYQQLLTIITNILTIITHYVPLITILTILTIVDDFWPFWPVLLTIHHWRINESAIINHCELLLLLLTIFTNHSYSLWLLITNINPWITHWRTITVLAHRTPSELFASSASHRPSPWPGEAAASELTCGGREARRPRWGCTTQEVITTVNHQS